MRQVAGGISTTTVPSRQPPMDIVHDSTAFAAYSLLFVSCLAAGVVVGAVVDAIRRRLHRA